MLGAAMSIWVLPGPSEWLEEIVKVVLSSVEDECSVMFLGVQEKGLNLTRHRFTQHNDADSEADCVAQRSVELEHPYILRHTKALSPTAVLRRSVYLRSSHHPQSHKPSCPPKLL